LNKIDKKEISNSDLLKLYNDSIKIALKLREELKTYLPTIETYKNIEYVFWHNGKRYYTKEIRLSWLSDSSPGEIILNYGQIVKDLEEEYKNGVNNIVRDIMNRHFQKYYTQLKAMAHSDKVNQGYAAEAYEEHLQQHHPEIFKILNQKNIKRNDPVVNYIIQNEKQLTDKSFWSYHEEDGAFGAWRHYRSAKGTMRGTVAGDVGKYQVKFDNPHISSITTISEDIKNYAMIIDKTIPVKQVAHLLMYQLSENIQKDAADFSTLIANGILDDSLIRHI
jgi:hypothetical protein